MIREIFEMLRNIGIWVFVCICYLELSRLSTIDIEVAKQILNTFIFVSIGILSGLSFFKVSSKVIDIDNKFISRVGKNKSIDVYRQIHRVARLLLITIVNSTIFYLLMLIFQTSSQNKVDILYVLPSQFFLFWAFGDLIEVASQSNRPVVSAD